MEFDQPSGDEVVRSYIHFKQWKWVADMLKHPSGMSHSVLIEALKALCESEPELGMECAGILADDPNYSSEVEEILRQIRARGAQEAAEPDVDPFQAPEKTPAPQARKPIYRTPRDIIPAAMEDFIRDYYMYPDGAMMLANLYMDLNSFMAYSIKLSADETAMIRKAMHSIESELGKKKLYSLIKQIEDAKGRELSILASEMLKQVPARPKEGAALDAATVGAVEKQLAALDGIPNTFVKVRETLKKLEKKQPQSAEIVRTPIRLLIKAIECGSKPNQYGFDYLLGELKTGGKLTKKAVLGVLPKLARLSSLLEVQQMISAVAYFAEYEKSEDLKLLALRDVLGELYKIKKELEFVPKDKRLPFPQQTEPKPKTKFTIIGKNA